VTRRCTVNRFAPPRVRPHGASDGTPESPSAPCYTAGMRRISFCHAATALLAGGALACAGAPSDDPELLLTGGVIYPLGDTDSAVEALAIRGDSVLALGTNTEILQLAGNYSQQMNLDGAVVFPGSYDAWVDLEALGRWSSADLDLRLASSIEEVQAMVRNAAGTVTTEADAWLVGWGWDENDWPTPVLPDRAALDAAVVDHPVVLLHRNGRAAWLNSAAFAALPGGAAGAIPGGTDGVLRGRLPDALRAVLAGDAGQRRAWLAEGARQAAAAGITRVATAPLDAAAIEHLLDLEFRGLLPLRVDVRLSPEGAASFSSSRLQGRVRDSALVRVVGVGVRLDGPLASRLAAVAEPYAGREPGPAPIDGGYDVAAAAAVSRAAGFPLHVHASGDLAVAAALEARASGAAPDVQIIGFDLLPAEGLGDLTGLKVAIAPARFSRDIYWLDRVLGAERAHRAHAWSDLAAAGVSLSFASDAPAYPLRPLAAMAAALTRQDTQGYPAGGWNPDQALARGRLVRVVVGEAGSLGAGDAADLVVWSEDPMAADAGALRRAQALLTIVAGRVAYSRALVQLPMGTERSP